MQIFYPDFAFPICTQYYHELELICPCYQLYVLHKKVVGKDKYSESLSVNKPNGLLSFPGAKLNTNSLS